MIKDKAYKKYVRVRREGPCFAHFVPVTCCSCWRRTGRAAKGSKARHKNSRSGRNLAADLLGIGADDQTRFALIRIIRVDQREESLLAAL